MRNELTKKMRAKGYLTVAEAAEEAGVALTTMYTWLDKKLINSRKVGGGRYVHEKNLQEYLR